MADEADFHIKDGVPNFWNSDSIWVRQDDPPAGWTDTTWNPPGDYQTPVKDVGVQNYVWVRVSREGPITGNPTDPELHLWVARGGPHFFPADLDVPTNDDLPGDPTNWSDIVGNHCVRIERFPGVPTVNLKSEPPPDGAEPICKWYRYTWAYDRVPPVGASPSFHPCLLAWAEAPLDPNTGGNVPTNDNFAQRNISVTGIRAGMTVKRRVILGNQQSKERRMHVIIKQYGRAARGADVQVRFIRPRRLIRRIAIAERNPMRTKIPRKVFRNRLPDHVSVPITRDLPPAFGLRRVGNKLKIVRTDSGFMLSTKRGEVIEMELSITPKRRGRMVVDVAQTIGSGVVVGGVTHELKVR